MYFVASRPHNVYLTALATHQVMNPKEPRPQRRGDETRNQSHTAKMSNELTKTVLTVLLLALTAQGTTGTSSTIFKSFGPRKAIKSKTVRGICPTKTPKLASKGDSCGVAPFVNITQFGDNADTNGRMTIRDYGESGISLDVRVYDLPRDDLVLTAWLVWLPFGTVTPKVFEV